MSDKAALPRKSPVATPTQRRVALVLARIAATCADDPSEAECFSDALDEMLDFMRENDNFGVDGASDPRGDWVYGDWAMDCVQGIDRFEFEE